jgi:hypothetical protein
MEFEIRVLNWYKHNETKSPTILALNKKVINISWVLIMVYDLGL